MLKIIVSSFLIIFLCGFIFVFICYTYLEFRRDLVIELIDLPKELQERGYTNKSLKKIILDKLNVIEKSVNTIFYSYDTVIEKRLEKEPAKNQNLPKFTSSNRFGDVSGENPPKLEVKLEGISIPLDSFINFFVEYIKRFFGCPRTHVVCNVTMQSNSANLKIITQIDRNPVNINNGSLENLDSTMASIAEYIYKCKEPFVLAQYLYINRRQEDCLGIIKYCIQNSPTNDDHLAYNLWGRILYIQKNYDDAIKKYKMAIALYPKYAPAYYNWGLPLHDKGEHEEAIEKYKNAIEINARCAPAYFNWALILCNKKDYGPAKEKYQMALKYAPLSAHPEIYNNLGGIFFYQEKYNDTIEMCKKAIEINPLDDVVYCNWGLALYMQKDFEKAIEAFETATEIKPSADAHYMCGLAQHNQGKSEEAIGNFKKFLELELDPNNPLANEANNYINELTRITKESHLK